MAPAAPGGGQQQFTQFVPQQQQKPSDTTMAYFGDEAPLLEELGIDAAHILNKTKAVVLPFSRFNGNNVTLEPTDIVESADMAGTCRGIESNVDYFVIRVTFLTCFPH